MATTTLGLKQLDCKDLHGYLKTLSPSILDNLYGHPATCLAVFRDLPMLARHYVMRVLFVEQPFSQTVVAAWVTTAAQKEHVEATEVLKGLRVWYDQTLPGGLPGWKLNDTFRAHLKIALLGGGQAWAGAGSLSTDKHGKDIPFLDEKAMERWECILHYMVGSREAISGVSREVVDILLHAGLMQNNDSGEPSITPAGFQFLLLDTPSQVWFFMLQYLNTAKSRNEDVVGYLIFLFQLTFSTLGKDYSTDSMTENQLKFLQHLREFGLVYQRKRKSQRFYPTRLVVNLACTGGRGSMSDHKKGYMVVETNHRVYAYTDSSLQVALIALFSEMIYRFPNMAVGTITRNSVREALARGITADQIINFLKSHAHPEMLLTTPVIPPTISDQIRLWELERDRFKFTEGVLYNQFLSSADFSLLRDYARDLGVLVWDNNNKRVMVVTRGGHDDVKRFWKRYKHDSA